MYTPVYTRQFERDLKLAVRRGKNIEKFKKGDAEMIRWCRR